LWLAIAAITASVQLDREARRQPALANAVPAPLRGFGQHAMAARYLAAKQDQQALAAARILIARRPMRAEHVRLFAQAQALRGNQQVSALTIQQAARRGWRDPIAQRAMLAIALEAGDGAEAGRRLAALWMLSRDREMLNAMTPPVLADASGRREFKRLLGKSERLRQRFRAYSPPAE